jgi:dTDP-4-amino-4,6-dideoxygalactose transaminase
MIELSKVSYSKSTRQKILKVLKSGKLAQGELVSKFEREFAEYLDSDYAVAVNSGTSALHLSLLGLGVGPGDEVIVPAFTFAATANVVALVGAKAVFVDVDLNTFNINPGEIESKVTARTKAIIVVHLYGLPCEMKSIVKIAKDHQLFLIEDCAQACGSRFEGKLVGTFGDVGCFSFYATKNLSTGEGGMVTVKDPKVQKMIQLYRNQGMIVRYQHEIPGFNNRMQEISAVLGMAELKSLEQRNRKRISNAEFYLSNLPLCDAVQLPKIYSNFYHTFHQFTLRVNSKSRHSLIDHLNANRIQAKVYYPTPVYRLKAFNEDLFLPNAELLSQTVISIPVHSYLNKYELRYIVKIIKEWIEIENYL